MSTEAFGAGPVSQAKDGPSCFERSSPLAPVQSIGSFPHYDHCQPSKSPVGTGSGRRCFDSPNRQRLSQSPAPGHPSCGADGETEPRGSWGFLLSSAPLQRKTKLLVIAKNPRFVPLRPFQNALKTTQGLPGTRTALFSPVCLVPPPSPTLKHTLHTSLHFQEVLGWKAAHCVPRIPGQKLLCLWQFPNKDLGSLQREILD